MKICMVSYSVYEYDNRVHRAAEALCARGDSVDVFCLGRDEELPAGNHDGVRLFRVQERVIDETHPGSYIKKMFSFFFKVFFLLTGAQILNRYDIIHFHNIPDIGIFCTIPAKLLGAGIILDIHDLVPEFTMRKFGFTETHGVTAILRWMERISCRYADHVLTVTELWRRIICSRSVPPSKCSVVLNAPYPPLFDPFRGSSVRKGPKSFRILYHGALNEHFGVETAVRAMPLVIERFPEVVLDIVGNGREKMKLLRLSRSLLLDGHVRFHKPVRRESIPPFIRYADMGVVPKRADTFADTALSSKLLEFVYMNKPVVVSRTTASQTYFEEPMVRFFEPGDPDDLACQIIDLIAYPDKREQMKRATKRFVRRHPWERYAMRYFDVIQKVSGHKTLK